VPGGLLSAVDVRPCASLDEFHDAFYAIGQYFGPPPDEARAQRFLRNLELERMHAAWSEGSIAGGTGAFAFDLSVPGGCVPCAGVTLVGVHPTHRRRGVLRAMMRAQLDDVRERGEPIAALWASEERIYGRFGYGMASLQGEIALARERSGFDLPHEPRTRARFVEAGEAAELFPPVWEAVRAERPGVFARTADWWESRVLADPADRREAGMPKRFVALESGSGVEGYAIYRTRPAWEQGVSVGKLTVIEALGATAAATRDVWRFLLDVDWVETIEAYLLPVDHPLFLLLAEPRRARFRVGDGLWVRLVDVGAALSARSYADDGCIVFEVADAFCPSNEGRWRLEGGEAARSDDEPDLRLDVSALGSAYLGGFTFAQLHRALRVEELRPGSLARADRIFRTDVGPWCPEIF
jgi:predicted acetyltransferase